MLRQRQSRVMGRLRPYAVEGAGNDPLAVRITWSNITRFSSVGIVEWFFSRPTNYHLVWFHFESVSCWSEVSAGFGLSNSGSDIPFWFGNSLERLKNGRPDCGCSVHSSKFFFLFFLFLFLFSLLRDLVRDLLPFLPFLFTFFFRTVFIRICSILLFFLSPFAPGLQVDFSFSTWVRFAAGFNPNFASVSQTIGFNPVLFFFFFFTPLRFIISGFNQFQFEFVNLSIQTVWVRPRFQSAIFRLRSLQFAVFQNVQF